MNIILGSLISYIVGSINFAYIIGKLMKIDISRFFDENLGATNLYYCLRDIKGSKFAFLFFLLAGLLDMVKAVIPTLLFGPLPGAFAIVGHCFSLPMFILTRKMPSGVGLASSIGWALVVDWKLIIIGLILAPLQLISKDIPFKIERGHIISPFLFTYVFLIYVTFFPCTFELKVSFLIIAFTIALARLLRLRIVLRELIKG